MANERFRKIANALNSSFVEEDSDSHLPVVAETKPNLPAVVEEKKTVFDEQDYVKNKLHDTIDMMSEVMGTLKKDLRQGSKASEFEAFSSLGKTVVSAINELRTYDTVVKHEENYDQNAMGETAQTSNITINMNGADMLDRILQYRDKQVTTIPTEISEE